VTTNKGKWRPWYQLLNEGDDPQPYGDDTSYQILADWVADCDLVEDWGCGKGYMRNFIAADRYIGIDGTASPFVDVIADLADLADDPNPDGQPEGVVMRHVIEHDLGWERILTNVSQAFLRRCAIAVFTPMAAETTVIAFNSEIGIPDISFNPADITRPFAGCTIATRRIESKTQYGEETIFLIERNAE